jgi:hypothetical protein
MICNLVFSKRIGLVNKIFGILHLGLVIFVVNGNNKHSFLGL